MTSIVSFLATFLMPAIVLAASGGEAHAEGVPSVVLYQAINFAIYAALLFFVLRKPVKNYFSGREASYKQALVKAEAARKEAEAKRREIQERLNKLEASSADSIAQARADAEALRAKILQDAEDLSKNLKEEARRTANLEIDRATTQLREELLSQSVALSRKILSEKMAEPDQKRLQSEFVDKIQVVP